MPHAGETSVECAVVQRSMSFQLRKQFGSGTMEDPLRHAVGMRTAQAPWIGWGTGCFRKFPTGRDRAHVRPG